MCWCARNILQYVGPPVTLDEAHAAALEATEKPYLISDSGDNPGAGGTGDVTWTLSRILQRPEFTAVGGPTTFVASIFDQAALAQLRTQAIGDRVDARRRASDAVPKSARANPRRTDLSNREGSGCGRHCSDSRGRITCDYHRVPQGVPRGCRLRRARPRTGNGRHHRDENRLFRADPV